MELVNEYRSESELKSWVSSQGIEWVSYYLWETEFSFSFSEEEVLSELQKIVG